MLLLAGFPHNSVYAQDVCELVKSTDAKWIVRMPFEVIDGRIYVQAHVATSFPEGEFTYVTSYLPVRLRFSSCRC